MEQYKIKLETEDENLLDEYVNYTYLLETEKSLEHNINLIKKKVIFFISLSETYYQHL